MKLKTTDTLTEFDANLTAARATLKRLAAKKTAIGPIQRRLPRVAGQAMSEAIHGQAEEGKAKAKKSKKEAA